ncbi:endonuclease/exonuclease/phosphatase family protein [soil metagenome]
MTVLRLATFNLLHGVSLADGSVEQAALQQVARALDADVVGLQEVDRGQERSGGVDQTAVVAAALGARAWRFVPVLLGTPDGTRSWTAATVDDGSLVDGPSYGVGLVSRLPVREWAVLRFRAAPVRVPLLVPGANRLIRVADEPRVAVAAVVDTAAGPLTVVTTHLSFAPGWNLAQLRRLTRWARRFPAPRIILGDLNLPGALPGRVSGWTRLARVATYPTPRPRVQFDHVLADGLSNEAVMRVAALPLAVSDHCALVVDIDL